MTPPPTLMTEDSVRAHLGSILASHGFANAERLSRFLEYTVNLKLRGEETQIKEFALGRDVFDRGSDYDPRLDPIVRVEARRLRQRLAEYYEGPGRGEALRIEFPKGSYAPVITDARTLPARQPAQPKWRTALVAAAGLALLVVAAAGYWLQSPAAVTPMMAVVPARWVWATPTAEEFEASDEALAEAITAEFANRSSIPVLGWPLVANARGALRDWQPKARQWGVAHVLLVAVRREAGGDGVRVTVYRLESATGRKISVRDYAARDLDDPAAREKLARQIVEAAAE